MFRILIFLFALIPALCSADVYNGSSWLDADCNYYNGSSWVSCTGYTYNGSSWVEVDNAGDITAPTFSSATINDTAATVTLSEDVVITGLDDGDFVFTGSTAGAVNLTSCTESAGVISCTTASSFASGETVTAAYSGGADEVEDTSGNDLATFSGSSVTNNTAAACDTTWISQETRNTYVSKQIYSAQKLNVDSEQTVCEVQLLFRADDATSYSAHIEFWSDATRSGTQYGASSISVSIADTDTLWEWFTFTWSGTKPNFSGDVYMHVVWEGLDKFQLGASNTVTSYDDTNYDFWRDNTTPVDFDVDICMRIKTE